MNFNNIVKELIAPILSLYSFTLIDEFEGFLSYENKLLKISISYDSKASYEVDIYLLFKISGEFYSYSEMKEYLYGKKSNYIAIQVVNEINLKLWVEEIRNFLMELLEKIYANYIEISFDLNRIQAENSITYANEAEDNYIKENAERFWRAKDYLMLVDFLKKYEVKLSGSLKKKYEYALKRISEL